jgi:NDP-sugar pyrophosphorylase family protein
MMENYKVVILAAGVGSRMENFTKSFNKALIPVQGKPAICHTIEKFPENIVIVIALGYKKESLTDYLKTAYPKRKFSFVDVNKYEGPGTGPGYSLLQCKNELQCPFIFLSVDTLVREDIPAPVSNWFGLAQVPNTERFCSASIDSETEKITRIDDKIKTDNKFAFIGLSGVKDYEHFWRVLEGNETEIAGEIQVSNGFKSLIEKDMVGKVFTWFDTGTPSSYVHALENYPYGDGYLGL